MKKLWLLTALAALLFPIVALASPGLKLDRHELRAKQCDPQGPPLVNVHYTLVNDYDSGFGGNAWANDTIERHLRIWQVAGGFCAIVRDEGRFVTFAGISPSGSATVSAGIRGRLDGGYRSTVFAGDFAPALPVRGDLGTFDLACDLSFNCPGTRPSPLAYFSSASGFDFAWWGWIYRAGHGHGTWLNQIDVLPPDSGDITG